MLRHTYIPLHSTIQHKAITPMKFLNWDCLKGIVHPKWLVFILLFCRTQNKMFCKMFMLLFFNQWNHLVIKLLKKSSIWLVNYIPGLLNPHNSFEWGTDQNLQARIHNMTFAPICSLEESTLLQKIMAFWRFWTVRVDQLNRVVYSSLKSKNYNSVVIFKSHSLFTYIQTWHHNISQHKKLIAWLQTNWNITHKSYWLFLWCFLKEYLLCSTEGTTWAE